MKADSLLPSDWPGGWPPSNYPILLAIVLLVVSALSIVVSTEAVANEMATYAYLALVAGVGLRLLEHLGGNAIRLGIATAVDRGGSSLRTAMATVRPDDGGPTGHAGQGGSGRRASLIDRRAVHGVARNTLAATLAGGLAILVYWWRQPAITVAGSFLLAWALVLWLLASVAVASWR